MFVFGKNGQTADQQLKEASERYGAAKQQTGIDPKAPAPAGKTAEQKAAEQKAAAENVDAPKGGRAKGAVRGAAGGAAIGAIAGDAGKGAGAGAVAGTMRGGAQQKQVSAAAQKEAAAKVAAHSSATRTDRWTSICRQNRRATTRKPTGYRRPKLDSA